MKELIEKIGGRERLESIVYAMGAEPCDADPILDSVTHGDIGKMARALLAVLDAQEKPAYFIRFDEDYGLEVSSINQFNGGGKGFPVWTTPPASSDVKLPTTRLWAGTIECYAKDDVISLLKKAGIEVSDD